MKSLRLKILLPLLAGLTLLFLVLPVYSTSTLRSANHEFAVHLAEAHVNRIAGQLDLLYRSMLLDLQSILLKPSLAELLANPDNLDQNSDWLQRHVRGNDHLREILLVDQSGICLASSNIGSIGRDCRDLPHVQRALAGLINFGAARVSESGVKISIPIAAPLDLNGRPAGALVLNFELPQILDYLSRTLEGHQSLYTALLGPDGELLTNHDVLDAATANDYADLYASLTAVDPNGMEIAFEFRGESYLGFALRDKTSNWLILSSGSEEGVYASTQLFGSVLIVFLLLILISMLAATLLTVNGITGTVQSLNRYSKRIGEGDYATRLPGPLRTDELGDLQKSVKAAVSSLRSALEQAEEGSRLKGEFLANMSHEIRTPLNAIIGLAYLSLRDTDISDKQKSNIEQIQISAKSLLGVINDILDISKIESGKLVLEESKFNLRETLEQTMSIHEMSVKAKGLTMDLEYDPMLPERFVGDPVRLGQIINNLLSNAVKFTSHGGIKVRASAIGGVDDLGRMQMRISVIDTGIGISRKALESLFQPFTQADASITRKYGGTGLGLAISDRLVHLMQGRFSVDSEPDAGSNFSFSIKLPVDMEEFDQIERNKQGDAFSQLNLKGKTILIVEDNQLNQMILEELITPSKAAIITADNGLEAVEALAKQRFDLIFMDMQMPIMDGLKATEIIRRDYSAEQLPIIAVTANAMKEDMEKGFACGMNDYLTKPVEPDHLAELLHKWLGAKRSKNEKTR